MPLSIQSLQYWWDNSRISGNRGIWCHFLLLHSAQPSCVQEVDVDLESLRICIEKRDFAMLLHKVALESILEEVGAFGKQVPMHCEMSFSLSNKYRGDLDAESEQLC